MEHSSNPRAVRTEARQEQLSDERRAATPHDSAHLHVVVRRRIVMTSLAGKHAARGFD
jgi:hypothetical protein